MLTIQKVTAKRNKIRDILWELPVTTLQGEYYSSPISYEQVMEKYYGKEQSDAGFQ